MHDTFNACEWLLDRHVSSDHGNASALRCQGQTFTYADMLDKVERVATGLRALGVRSEERVALAMLDSPELIATFLGALRIGAVPLLTNPLLPGRDLGVIIADARARVAVMSSERSASIGDITVGAPELNEVITTADTVDAGATMTWSELCADASDGSPHDTWTESPGFWLCTSGSTGQPKLAMHRHGDVRLTHETYARHVLNLDAGDRCFSVGPMFHAYGLGNSLTFPFAVGATSILEPTRPPTAALVADIMQRERPTFFFCIPTFYAALNAARLADDTFASVRYGVSAAEPLPAETFERFRERYGVTILDGIGSTEMLHIYVSNTPSQHRAGTSGKPVPGYDVRLIDDSGHDQPPGRPGQLIVRGESAAVGYWCRAEQTRATFVGSWTHTGDLYDQTDDGFFTYLGRIDDMLRVGGEWVSPAEVEAVLLEHPSVLEAAVVGERDVDGVLRPIAHVTGTAGAAPDRDALAAHCRDRLAGYKRPHRYELVTELPKTATGKIQRFKLRG